MLKFTKKLNTIFEKTPTPIHKWEILLKIKCFQNPFLTSRLSSTNTFFVGQELKSFRMTILFTFVSFPLVEYRVVCTQGNSVVCNV